MLDCWKNRNWTSIEDPRPVCPEGADSDVWMSDMGFILDDRIGDEIGIHIEIRRKGPEGPAYVEFSTPCYINEIYVESPTDLIDLLAHLSPIVIASLKSFELERELDNEKRRKEEGDF